jgi:hypothetical protein
MTAIEPLNAVEADELADCEQRIASGIEAFRDVGQALKHVRDFRLYRATHATFEDYCRDRWGWSARRGYQLMDAADAIAGLSPECEPLVHTERAARELAKVEPKDREEVVRKAAESGSVTAKAIKEAAAEVLPDAEPPAAPSVPEDRRSREFRVSRRMQEIETEVKDFLTGLNPQRRDLIQAALTLKHLAAELERAAAELPE